MTKPTKVKLAVAGSVFIAAITFLYSSHGPEPIIETPEEIVELVETIDIEKPSVELTEEQYQILKRDLKEKFAREEISLIDFLYVDTPEMKVLRAIVNEEKNRVEGNITKENLLFGIIGEAIK